MTTRSLLVRFPGYPFDPALLLPDAELAGIAGALQDAGHRCTILDFGCAELARRMAPRLHRKTVERVMNRWLPPLPATGTEARPIADSKAVAEAHAAFLGRRSRLCAEIGEDLSRERWVDFLAFKVDTPDDLTAAHLIIHTYRRAGGRRPVIAFGRLIRRYGPCLTPLRGGVDSLCAGDAVSSLLRMAGRVARQRPVDPRDAVWVQPSGQVHAGSRCHAHDTPHDAPPLPRYGAEAYPVLQGNAKLKLFSVTDAYGCPCACNACTAAGPEARHRLRAPGSVAEEAQCIASEHGLGALHLGGYAGSAAHLVAVAHELHRRLGPIRWARRIHADAVNADAVPVLRALGLEAAEFAVNSGSQRLLDETFGTRVRVSLIEPLLRAANETSVHATVRLVFPLPDDDYHTREETLRLLRRTQPAAVQLAMPEVTPGSHWHAHAEAFGFIPEGAWEAAAQHPYGPLSFQRYPLPLRMGGVAPYRHGKLSPAQAMQAHDGLRTEIEGMEIPTGFSAPLALAARIAGHPGGEAAWVRALQRALFLGDVDYVEANLAAFNKAAAQPVNMVSFPGNGGMSRAVGS